MARSAPKYPLFLALLTLVAVLGCSSGGSTGDHPPTDGDADQDVQDIIDEDASADTELVETDKETPDGDSEEAVETDGDQDETPEADTEADAEADSEESAPALPFTAFTSGGGSVGSEHYKLKLFFAPVQPTGSAAGTQYKIKLGPGGLQR